MAEACRAREELPAQPTSKVATRILGLEVSSSSVKATSNLGMTNKWEAWVEVMVLKVEAKVMVAVVAMAVAGATLEGEEEVEDTEVVADGRWALG